MNHKSLYKCFLFFCSVGVKTGQQADGLRVAERVRRWRTHRPSLTNTHTQPLIPPFRQRSLGHKLAFPAAGVRPNICIANCSHSQSTLKKGRLWAQAFSPITAALSLIPQLHAMCKFHPPTGLIPTTQHPYSNLIPKGAFDLRAYGTRSFGNVPLVTSQGLCTAVTLSLFFSLEQNNSWKRSRAILSGKCHSHLPLKYFSFSSCCAWWRIIHSKCNFFLLKCRLLLWPEKKTKTKTSLDELSNGDAALRKWVCEADYKWCITTVIWTLSWHILGQTKELVWNERKRGIISPEFHTNICFLGLRTSRDKQSALPLTLHQFSNNILMFLSHFWAELVLFGMHRYRYQHQVPILGLRTLVILFC